VDIARAITGDNSPQRRDAPRGEDRSSATNSGVCRDSLEIIRRIGEGQATVARAVLVTAFEGLAVVAEEERAWRHQVAFAAGSILKRTGGDDRDAIARVPLFEWAIMGTAGTYDLVDGPTFAKRNFCQESAPSDRL
jgi:hypothetical protein